MEYSRVCPFRPFTDYCLTPQDFIIPAISNYYRPWKWYTQGASKDFGSTVEHGKDKFKITLDVQHFRPEEISVKASDKEVIVEAKHEERQDEHGYISRQFRRKYALPNNFPPDNVVSSLSSDGILTIIAERQITGTEKIVPITFCGTHPRKAESRITTGITQKDIDDTIREANELIIKNKAHNLVKNDNSRLLNPEIMCDTRNGEAKAEMKYVNDLPNSSTPSVKLDVDIGMKKLGEAFEEQNVFSSSELNASSEPHSTKTVSESIKQESSYKSVSSAIKKSGEMSDLNEVISAELREAADNIYGKPVFA